jgi:hypothetical protein
MPRFNAMTLFAFRVRYKIFYLNIFFINRKTIFLQVFQIASPASKLSQHQTHFLLRDPQILWYNPVPHLCNRIKWHWTMGWFSLNPKGHLFATLTQGLTRNKEVSCIGQIRVPIKLLQTYGAHLRIMVSRTDLTSTGTRTVPQPPTTAVAAVV